MGCRHLGLDLALAAWLGLLVRVTLWPAWVPSSPPFPHWDKVVHALSWAVLAVLAAGAARDRRALMVAFGGALVVGLAVELGQVFVPGRSCDPMDLAADAAGAAAGVVWTGRALWLRAQSPAGNPPPS